MTSEVGLPKTASTPTDWERRGRILVSDRPSLAEVAGRQRRISAISCQAGRCRCCERNIEHRFGEAGRLSRRRRQGRRLHVRIYEVVGELHCKAKASAANVLAVVAHHRRAIKIFDRPASADCIALAQEVRIGSNQWIIDGTRVASASTTGRGGDELGIPHSRARRGRSRGWLLKSAEAGRFAESRRSTRGIQLTRVPRKIDRNRQDPVGEAYIFQPIRIREFDRLRDVGGAGDIDARAGQIIRRLEAVADVELVGLRSGCFRENQKHVIFMTLEEGIKTSQG